MTPAWELAVPFAAFFMNVASNFFALRLFPSLGIVRSLILSFAAGLLVEALAESALYLRFASHSRAGLEVVLANFLIYSSAWYFFFHFVHIPVASVRIRILRELVARSSMTREQICRRYGADHILSFRLSRLIASDQVRESGGRYFEGIPKMLYIARSFQFFKRLAFGRPEKSSLKDNA